MTDGFQTNQTEDLAGNTLSFKETRKPYAAPVLRLLAGSDTAHKAAHYPIEATSPSGAMGS
jgi:hypothetical protein